MPPYKLIAVLLLFSVTLFYLNAVRSSECCFLANGCLSLLPLAGIYSSLVKGSTLVGSTALGSISLEPN